MAQQQIRKEAQRTYSKEELAAERSQAAHRAPETTKAATEAVLEDIDQLLEETLTEAGESAQEFVARYHQKGGQ